MIQANELRIGNWLIERGIDSDVKGFFYDRKGDKFTQIAGRDIDTIESEERIEGAAGYEPIPLTPEILEKCGFEKGCLAKDITDEWFIYYNDGLWMQVEKHTDNKTVCERIPLFHIKYLHQLQNLYFALTGKELEISL